MRFSGKVWTGYLSDEYKSNVFVGLDLLTFVMTLHMHRVSRSLDAIRRLYCDVFERFDVVTTYLISIRNFAPVPKLHFQSR